MGFAKSAEEAVSRRIGSDPPASGASLEVAQHFLGGGVVELAGGQ
jgi:hypothetical protein